ncbi:MAG: site-specific integrase [Wenzhouxiangellaceae bacterium]
MSSKTGLTERALKAAKPPEKGYSLIWDSGSNRIPGFAARVTSAASCSFVLDYRIWGRKRRITIGRWPAWSVQAARERAAKLYREVQTGDDPLEARAASRDAASNTLGKYLADEYADHQRHKKSGEQTLSIIRNSFDALLNKPLPAITKADIKAWRARRESDGLKFQTIKRHFDALQGLLNHAAKNGAIEANPLHGHKLDRPASTEQEQLERVTARKMLDETEVKALFAGLDAFSEHKRDQRRRSRAHGKTHLPDLDALPFAHVAVPWLRLAYFTGFRPGDLFGLRWEHIELDKQRIRKVIEKTADHRPEPRIFPLSPAAVDTLRAWWQQSGKPTSGYVFKSERTGGRMDKHAMQKPWKQIKELGKLPEDIELYSLRHNFASQLIRAGTDIFTVSKLMAHTDIQTTIDNYAHLAPDHAAQAVANLPGADHE